MGEQPKGKQPPIPSLCRAGDTRSHNRYHSRRLRKAAMPFHNTAHLKDSELHLLPADPVAGCHSHGSVAVIAGGSVSVPLLHPRLRPALTSFPWTLQGFAAQRCQRHRHQRGTRKETCPCRPAALAQLSHPHTHQRGPDLPSSSPALASAPGPAPARSAQRSSAKARGSLCTSCRFLDVPLSALNYPRLFLHSFSPHLLIARTYFPDGFLLKMNFRSSVSQAISRRN